MTEAERVSLYFLARLLYWRGMLDSLDDNAVLRVVAVMESVRADIRNRLFQEAESLANVGEWTRERLEALDSWCDEVLARAKTSVTQTLHEASTLAAESSIAAYNAIISFEGKASAVNTIAMSREQIRSWFEKTPLGGRTLNGWIDRTFDDQVKGTLLASIQKSGVKGLGTASVVKEMVNSALDTGFLLAQRDAVTIARTFIQTANVEAQKAVYDANPEIVYGYEWCSVLDSNVCGSCAAMDGRKFRRGDEMPSVPLHPRCRCLLRPLVRIKALGITSEDLGEVTRTWTIREDANIDEGGNRKILQSGQHKGSFGEWWATLPYEEQVKSVGAIRTNLLRAGKISWDDMIDQSTGRMFTLKELGFNLLGRELEE